MASGQIGRPAEGPAPLRSTAAGQPELLQGRLSAPSALLALIIIVIPHRGERAPPFLAGPWAGSHAKAQPGATWLAPPETYHPPRPRTAASPPGVRPGESGKRTQHGRRAPPRP